MLFYIFKVLENLKDVIGLVKNFYFEWDNFKKFGIILGYYLFFLGFGVLFLVVKVMYFGGFYDVII